MKAYLYPDLFGYGYDNDIFNGDMGCRVEVDLLAVPRKDQMIVFDSESIAEQLYENCKKQLLNMKSTISIILYKVRRDMKNGNTKYIMHTKPEYADLSNIDLLHKVILEDDIGGFVEGVWYVNEVEFVANDDHLHITIYQEI